MPESSSNSVGSYVDKVADEFEAAWKGPTPPRIRDFLGKAPADAQAPLLEELILLDLEYRSRQGEAISLERYLQEFPQLAAADDAVRRLTDAIGHLRGGMGTAAPAAAVPPLSERNVPVQPRRIGRFRIEKLLGQGGFAQVFLAHDDQLQRLVAVKVPHRHRLSPPQEISSFLAEARTVASLDHPNIVPVYDVGSSDDCRCFIVSKFIEGAALAQRMKERRLARGEAAELVATIAEALHYAHRKKFVHRDVKPGNILIDMVGTPFVVDFGLASKEEKIGPGVLCVGTPAYMSPEQARGEGHRVDGRSDIFSLGVVFYELLTGTRPFSGDSQEELLEQVRTCDPRPPRQHDDSIPKELERICMKALARRASERYSTAKDLADDLRYWTSSQCDVKIRPGPAQTASLAAQEPGKDIFMSYASVDKEAADRLCKLIEEQGIGCWIAPRDVAPGDDYGDAIIQAIEAAPVTVLLLTSHANASVHVKNEIERATSKNKRVIPVRLEDVKPDRSLELHLSRTQWVDALILGLDQVALQLVQAVRGERGKSVVAALGANPASGTRSLHQPQLFIVPKGLRSFDAHDADFFLELLPGPRDREGLPDSIRFWKTRIEETDADNTFAVGLIYGPSGCGKSSLVKAGLLPHLSEDVIAVYVEATAEETETRLLNGLRKRCPALPANLALTEMIAELRRGQGAPAGKKVLIVLDQFEQWLHAKREEQNTELVRALRQCDGSRVQCVVMVRDDFWMATTEFMRDLEFRLLEGQNSAAVDLFDTDHARKVLSAFGRTFGKLPENPSQTSSDQKQFLTQSVSGLGQKGKVISVRLALFAEMMKGRPWTLASLREVGGTEGVGVTFLEETFSAATAPPEHRYHQKAARAVLKSLLPESGTDIKGHMRSHADLLKASGYANRAKDFDDLIRILDGEIRLLTPTDPEGKEGAEEFDQPAQDGDLGPGQDAQATVAALAAAQGNKYYQLTHDYLVPALRDWLTRKQKETPRGRAELLLADRADVWNARPENRQLPSLRQWLSIRSLTQKRSWTAAQRKMMGRAARYHAMRGTALALVLTVATVLGLTIRSRVVQQQRAAQATALVKRLIVADIAQVPDIVKEFDGYRQWADPLLRQENAKPDTDPREKRKLHTSLALLPADPGQVDFLYGQLLTADPKADPNEVPVILDALSRYKDALIEKLWSVVKMQGNGMGWTRLRAAAALARFDPNSEKWKECSQWVVTDIVGQSAVFLGQLSEAFRPVKDRLIPALKETFRDRDPERSPERNLATNLLVDYAAGRPLDLADLLMDADKRQFAAIFPKFKDQVKLGLPALLDEIDRKLRPDAMDDARETLAKRQANAAVALLKLNQPENWPSKVWPLLRQSPDPRTRSYLIDHLSRLGADPRAIIRQLDEEPDLSIRRALILSLGGEFGEQDLSSDERKLLTTRLQDLYRNGPDPGLHAAVEWLLRTWKQQAWLHDINEQWAKDDASRVQRLKAIAQALTSEASKTSPEWYVNGQGQTMVVIPGPVEFVMGSPVTEPTREDDETQHKVRIPRTFVLAAKPVTVEQYRRFMKDYKLPEVFTRTAELPVVKTSWYRAAAYCNWLSREEGLPEDQWCYETENGNVTQLKKNYLRLTGYRLPTEAEMEYAARAGAITSRYYGQTEDLLLGKYAWYLNNAEGKTHPVGTRMPNDLGFFDMHGNVWCWCQGQYTDYPDLPGSVAMVAGALGVYATRDVAIEDNEGDLSIIPNASRVVRGASYNQPPSLVRCAYRYDFSPNQQEEVNGFRAARTLPLGRNPGTPGSTVIPSSVPN